MQSKKITQKNQSNRHVPMRMCAVTRERLPKNELLRFVKTEKGIVLDVDGKVRGRGLNIKPDLEVLKDGIKRKVFERTLGKPLSQEVVQQFEQQLIKRNEGGDESKKVVRITSEQLDNLKQNK